MTTQSSTSLADLPVVSESDPVGLSPSTWVVASGRPEGPDAALNTPPVLASNFANVEGYSRSSGTDTWRSFEEVLGGLEQGIATAFGSGMAAISAVFDLLAVGAHVAVPADCYHGVTSMVAKGVASGRWTAEAIPTTHTDAWLSALDRSDLVWLESPSNPLMEIGDLPAICGATRPAGCLIAVDNTFATPIIQRPLDLGADVSVHSATKFIGGHSDLLMGATISRTQQVADSLIDRRSLGGATPGALEAFLATRGMRTLAIRLQASQRNASTLAERLKAHPGVELVRYPGLADHPGHALATNSLDGYGGVISFEVFGGARAADRLCDAVRLIRHATSLGGVESTMQRRAAIPGQGGVPEALVRLSVGIEDVEDIWADLTLALQACVTGR